MLLPSLITLLLRHFKILASSSILLFKINELSCCCDKGQKVNLTQNKCTHTCHIDTVGSRVRKILLADPSRCGQLELTMKISFCSIPGENVAAFARVGPLNFHIRLEYWFKHKKMLFSKLANYRTLPIFS